MSQLISLGVGRQHPMLENEGSLRMKLHASGLALRDYTTPWWPRHGLLGDVAVDVGALDFAWQGFELPEMTRGISSRLAFLGTSRDQYGSPLGGCTIICYRTTDRSFVSEVVSNADGSFFVNTFYPDQHFLVFYKAGFPDVFGTTVNTLVGS